MKVIKESFSVSAEDIFRCINNVEEAYSEFESALTSLSYYVTTKYPKEGNYIENDSSSIQETVQELFDDIDNIKTILSKENHVEESMKVIKEAIGDYYVVIVDSKEKDRIGKHIYSGSLAKCKEVINKWKNNRFDDVYKIKKAELVDTNESLKESKLNEEADDGWSSDVQYQLEEVLERAYNLKYEVDNCVRGAYTDCETTDELGEYVKRLGEDFTLIGEDLPNYPAYDEMGESLKEANLTEKKWEHQLPEDIAKGLRSAIDEGDIDTVGAMLQSAWSSIHEMMPEEFDEFDLEDKIQYIDDIEEEDEMDYELSDFYDFCDANSIWIPLD